eukprot:scaffold59587_cov43-Prasinocladus_malaysianus.AAC.1
MNRAGFLQNHAWTYMKTCMSWPGLAERAQLVCTLPGGSSPSSITSFRWSPATRWVGVFVSSYFGGVLLSLGEWIIRKVPVVKHVYSASKQISAAVNPNQEQAKAFKECVIIKHPRHGEYAFAFITGTTTLQVCAHMCLPAHGLVFGRRDDPITLCVSDVGPRRQAV